MKKDALIDEVAASSGMSKSLVRTVLEATTQVVTRAVNRGEVVRLFGLGRLSVVPRGPRQARHMVTGEPVLVEARQAIAFRPSDGLVRAANGDIEPDAPGVAAA